MEPSNRYAVTLQRAGPRTIAAVHARLAPDRVPVEFKRHLDRVYAARADGIRLDGQNVFLYQDAPDASGQLDVEFGVGTSAPVSAVGDVRAVALPVGEVATTTHRGDYGGLAAAHAAVLAWCRAHGRTPAGPRWEVYGHWTEVEPPRTDVYYLVGPDTQGS
jgi:Transcriptional regulator, effector-binding domain/component